MKLFALGKKDLFPYITEKNLYPNLSTSYSWWQIRTRDCCSLNSLFFPSKNIENGVSPYSDIFLDVLPEIVLRSLWAQDVAEGDFQVELDWTEKNMKKAVPQLILMTFFISVLEESFFSVFLLQYISPRKRATKSSFVLFTLVCFFL